MIVDIILQISVVYKKINKNSAEIIKFGNNDF